jgi:hypothetical protein
MEPNGIGSCHGFRQNQPSRARRGLDLLRCRQEPVCRRGITRHAGDGTRVRRKVYGKTKQDVRLKLKTLRSDIEAGVRAPASYTVQAAVDDWLAQGLSGRSERTLTLYRDAVKPLTDKIGARQLRKLTAA